MYEKKKEKTKYKMWVNTVGERFKPWEMVKNIEYPGGLARVFMFHSPSQFPFIIFLASTTLRRSSCGELKIRYGGIKIRIPKLIEDIPRITKSTNLM